MSKSSVFFLCVAFFATAIGAAVNTPNDSNPDNSASRTTTERPLQTNQVQDLQTMLRNQITETKKIFDANCTTSINELNGRLPAKQEALEAPYKTFISNLDNIWSEELRKGSENMTNPSDNKQIRDCHKRMDRFHDYYKSLKPHAELCVNNARYEASVHFNGAIININKVSMEIQSLKLRVSSCEDEICANEIKQKLRDISETWKKVKRAHDDCYRTLDNWVNKIDEECIHSETTLSSFRNSLIAAINATKKCISEISSSNTQSTTEPTTNESDRSSR